MKLARLNDRPEIFYSVQGEGKNIGTPSIFVRLADCNLKCVWCDTRYSWDWKRFDPVKEITERTVSEIVRTIENYPCRNIIFTGGEPMLQQRGLVEVMRRLKPNSCWFEVETNGTILPTRVFDKLINQYNCSPKLKNSGNQPGERERQRPLGFFSKSTKCFFKFVIARQRDLAEVEDFMDQYAISRGRVYLMPEGKTSRAVVRKAQWLVPFCREQNLCYSDRLHIRLFGDRRGT